MVPSRLLHIALCCLLLVSFTIAVVPSAAAPPPRPFCDACGESFEDTAASSGVSLTVTESSATITVHENGTATWVVRNQLERSAAATRLRTNASLRAQIAERAMRDAEFLGANVSAAGVVAMRYREVDFAERSVGGTLRSGAFTEEYGYRNLDGLGADRLTVVAPAGMHVDRTVPGATVSDDGRRMVLTQLDGGRFVTFVPDDAVLGPLLSVFAVGSLVAPTIAVNGLAYVAFPTAVFALLVGAAAGGLSWLDRDLERVRSAAGTSFVGVGVLTTVSFAVGGTSLLGGAAAPLFGVGIALAALGFAFSRALVHERASYRTFVAAATFGALVAAGATVVGAVAFDQNGLTRSLFSSLPFLAPVFALLPAGYAMGESRRLAMGTAAAGFAVAMVPLAPFTSPSIGLGSILIIVATAYAALVAAVGFPLLVVGLSFHPE